MKVLETIDRGVQKPNACPMCTIARRVRSRLAPGISRGGAVIVTAISVS